MQDSFPILVGLDAVVGVLIARGYETCKQIHNANNIPVNLGIAGNIACADHYTL